MEITINTYNLKDIKNQVIKHCIDNHPTLTISDIAKKLGVAERTLHRFGVKNRVKQCSEGRHRPTYDFISGGSCCSKCGILLNDFNKQYK